MSTPERGTGGIQSLDVAMSVLFSLANLGKPCHLKDLAGSVGMSPSKVHRYLVSFVQAGVVSQRPDSKRYELGPAAMRLGVAALGQNNFVRRAMEGLQDLTSDTGLAAHLSVWGTYGPVIVYWEHNTDFPPPAWRLGATLPLLDSAAGKVFLSRLSATYMEEFVQAEVRNSITAAGAWTTKKSQRAGVEFIRAETHAAGLATMNWPYAPSQCSIAAPVLNWEEEVEVVVSLIANEPDARILKPGDKAQKLLLSYVDSISLRPDHELGPKSK